MEPTTWSGGYLTIFVVPAAIVLLVQAGLIVALMRRLRRQSQVEHELQRERTLTNAVFDSVPGLLYLYRDDGKLIRWNKKHEEFTGYSTEEMAEMTGDDWYFPEDMDCFHQAWQGVMSTGQGAAEIPLKHKDGSRVPYFLTGVRVELEGRQHLVGIGMDITERKHLEADAKRQVFELAHVARVAMLGEFSASVAHELNQPLGAIMRYAEAAEMLLAGNSPDLDEIRSILAAIRKDDLRAAEVIRRLRELLAHKELQPVEVKTADLVSDALAVIRHGAEAGNIQMSSDLADNLPPVFGERIHLQQVLLNLLTNAMDAVAGQSEENRRIVLSARPCDDERVEFSVRDSGEGICGDNMERIFDSFFTTKPGGLGMGLSISRTIVEAHGGRIFATSQPGNGTTVKFTVPVANRRPLP